MPFKKIFFVETEMNKNYKNFSFLYFTKKFDRSISIISQKFKLSY